MAGRELIARVDDALTQRHLVGLCLLQLADHGGELLRRRLLFGNRWHVESPAIKP